MFRKTDDLRIEGIRPLISPAILMEDFPITEAGSTTVAQAREEIGRLLVGDDDSVTVGTPVVDGASVRGTITAQARHPKIRVFKMKRRKGYRRMQGHRQDYTEVRVDSIDQ